MPQVRITDEAHKAGLSAPMAAGTLIERFSLLIMRGVGRDEECRRAHMIGVIDMQDALVEAGVDKALAEKVAAKVIAGYK